MSISFNMEHHHTVVAANTHYYENPTEPLYLNRILQYHDFIYLESGRWLITEGTTDYLLEKDDVLLLSAEHHHFTRLPCLANTKTICLHVSNEEGDLTERAGCLTLPTLIHVKDSKRVSELFHCIVDECWSESELKNKKMSAYIDVLLYELSELHTNRLENTNDVSAEIISLINKNPHRMFRLSEISEMFGINAKAIESAMKANVGLSFAKYQMERKLEMAAQQLSVEPEITLAEIAALFGFYDAFHLSRQFKAKYSVSPSEYRKNACSFGCPSTDRNSHE